MKYKCGNDPNRNSVFLKLAGGTIFYDAKIAIDADADGAEFTKTHPGTTDQADTSFRYPLTSNSLDADRVAHVLPGSEFERPLAIKLGDITAVVYRESTCIRHRRRSRSEMQDRRRFNPSARDDRTKRLQEARSEWNV